MKDTYSITIANQGGKTYEVDRRRSLLESLREKGIDLKSHAKQWAAAETGEASLGKYWGGGRAKRDVS